MFATTAVNHRRDALEALSRAETYMNRINEPGQTMQFELATAITHALIALSLATEDLP